MKLLATVLLLLMTTGASAQEAPISNFPHEFRVRNCTHLMAPINTLFQYTPFPDGSLLWEVHWSCRRCLKVLLFIVEPMCPFDAVACQAKGATP